MSTRAARVLHALPSTTPELAAIEGVTVRAINADLQRLKRLGLVRRSDHTIKTKRRGQPPALWIRA
jgi:predicted transcriptional regulator